jgi:hypothetical protein
MISKLMTAFAMALMISLPVLAEDPPKKEPSAAQKAQQDRMVSCNKDAKEKALKGDDRKAFMKGCLSGEAPAAKGDAPQQTKMATCNKDASAKGLKGGDRKKFMSDCLRG